MIVSFRKLISRWKHEESAIAAVEAALIFPVMLTVLMSIYDFGNAILANQKAIRASQVVADLIARENVVDDADVSEAIEAGRLAFEPLSNDSYGVDIVSIRFNEDAEAEIVWRETENIASLPDAMASVEALETANDGVVMVTVDYKFEPLFAGFIIDTFDMRETAFSRGRSSPVITRDGS
ncbi:MAG: TadE/TadG family type IV pilus assembly protein [Alphaproteobacteria bacterium]